MKKIIIYSAVIWFNLLYTFSYGFLSYFGFKNKNYFKGLGRPETKPPVCGFPVKKCNPFSAYRRFDGSCTNPASPASGMAGDSYISVLPPKYGNERGFQKSGSRPLPLVRNIRTRLFPDGADRSQDGNVLFMAFGQMMAHDISRILIPQKDERCCSSSFKHQSNMHRSCYPINVPKQDIMNANNNMQCLNFTRAQTDKDLGCKSGCWPKQINSVTAALDLSVIYGSSYENNLSLRTGKNGQLKTVTREGTILPPIEKSDVTGCQTSFLLGDNRSHQNPGLLAIHTLLIKEHNRIANTLLKMNPHWEDSKLFHEARKILIAQYQYVAFYEWLPMVISSETLERYGITYNDWPTHINDFNPRVNPSPSNEYAHSAFVYFHSIIPDFFEFRRNNGSVTSYDWASNIFCQDILTRKDSMEELFRGMVNQPMASADKRFSESVTEKFERRRGDQFGTDLRSIDLQRGRDVGLGSYADYKRVCGEGPTVTFEDFERDISKEDVAKLRQIYETPSAVELSVGGSLENHSPGSKMGPTFECLVSEQFLRTRVGDLMWFEHSSSGFSTEQVSTLKDSSVSKMMCNSADGVRRIQTAGFVPPNTNNALMDCTNIPDINYSLWQEVVGNQ